MLVRASTAPIPANPPLLILHSATAQAGGFKADELSLWQETGCQRPAPLGGGPYTDNRAAGQNSKQRMLFLHKMNLSRRKEIRDLDPKDCQSKETE